jgi:DNA-binding NarL/FixJ family response regulator
MNGTARPRTTTAGLRVLVVDHRRAFAEAVAARLAQEPDVVVLAVVQSLEAAERALDDLDPTVATVAVDLADGGALVLVSQARRGHPATRWVVLGEAGAPLELADAVVAGASGYVTKDCPATALVETLRGAVAGLSITPEELLRRALVELDAPPHRSPHLVDLRAGAAELPHGPQT